MSADETGSNPGFIEDPWKKGSPCLAAFLGKDGILLSTGEWGNFGFLGIAPRETCKLARDAMEGNDLDAKLRAARIDGPGMLVLFTTPEDALLLGRQLISLGETMASNLKGKTDE
jgi:hypothetical protein